MYVLAQRTKYKIEIPIYRALNAFENVTKWNMNMNQTTPTCSFHVSLK